LSKISKLFSFNLFELADVFDASLVSRFVFSVATLGVCECSRTRVLAICGTFRASTFIDSSCKFKGVRKGVVVKLPFELDVSQKLYDKASV